MHNVSRSNSLSVFHKRRARFAPTARPPNPPGFKWLGNIAARLESEGYTVLFAYEEAIGFMFNAVHKVRAKNSNQAFTIFRVHK
jgi:hypothetical protein